MTAQRVKIFGKITEDLLVMSKVVFKQIDVIKHQLEGRDISDKRDDFIQNESILDSLEVKVRKNIINAIVLYGPRATDLRKIMSCYDMTSSLERIGDLLLNVHRFLNKVDFNDEIFKALSSKLEKLLATAETMTKNAIYAFSCEDILLTKATIELDDVADSIHAKIGVKLVSLSSASTLSEQQSIDVLSISSISYNLERIADNATNIAESAVYLMEGKSIKHSKNSYANSEE